MPAPGMRKADVVSQDLLRLIATGEVSVGALLPKETELAEQYGVNRSVVREAIKQLEVHRLVKPVRRRGTAVLDPLASLSPEVLQAMLSGSGGELDQDMLADLLDVRAVLDVEMSTRAADNRSDDDLRALQRALDALEDALGDPKRYAATMDQLTLALARATHNRVFEMLAHWNIRLRILLGDLPLSVRIANTSHLDGLRILVELIRKQQTDEIRTMVSAFHEWATPRLLAAAALLSGNKTEMDR
jgi:DNA-binding FadR family transcriptional regulator